MTDTTTTTTTITNGAWAIVELMGHSRVAGRIFVGVWADMIQVDIPTNDGGFRTEIVSPRAVYRIRFVSEEIARAYKPLDGDIYSYEAPIVTREAHNAALEHYREKLRSAEYEIGELRRRLTTIQLPLLGNSPEIKPEAPSIFGAADGEAEDEAEADDQD